MGMEAVAPAQAPKNVKENTSAIKKDLQEIRRMLSKIIGDIKGLRVGETKK